ncbi:MAG: efflux RND transporter periplasmic adaptor subunit [Chthoniobacterales bacterium]
MKARWETLLVLAASLSVAFGQGAPGPAPVIVEASKREEFVDRVEALGTLRANESVDLMATVTESVVRVGFEDGERVTKGQVLVEMVGAEEEARLLEARAEARQAKQQYDRAVQLSKSGASSKSTLDEAKRDYDTARARWGAIESQIGDFVIQAPFDGVVGLRNVSVGAMVRPGEMITTIDDDSVMKLDFTVPSTFLPVLEAGVPIRAGARAFPGETFAGEIRMVGSRVDPVTRSVTVRAMLPNEDRKLRPGLLMTVEVLNNPREAVSVPEEALRPVGTRTNVLTVDESGESVVVKEREVTVGARRGGRVEILTGLEAGEKVVTRGAMTAGDGAVVTVTAVGEGGETLDALLERAESGGSVGAGSAAGGGARE